jgi:hypothetical protein
VGARPGDEEEIGFLHVEPASGEYDRDQKR